MALVPIRTPQFNCADPTASLTSALVEFETSLTSEQKLVYRSNYAKPDAGDVIAFVSRIDADNKGRAKRCVAPRLCSFLNRTVQFTSVVDTFVNSNPATACLVWGGLKTAFLAASNVASYFDKVTGLIMQIGREAPTLEQFRELYPGSTGVQAALCAYYAIVVRLCKKIVEVANRSGLAQTFSPIFNPFEAEFKTINTDLQQACQDIKTQILLAQHQALREEAQLAKFERDQNSLHRRLVQNFQKDVLHDAQERQSRKDARQLALRRSTLMQKLSTIDHVALWTSIKKQLLPGTAEWYKDVAEYQRWREAATTSFLLFTGKMGCGKSVLASNIVAELLATRSTSDSVSYFFCKTGLPETLIAANIIGNICHQLLQASVQAVDRAGIDQLLQQVDSVSLEEVLCYIVSHISKATVHYIVIDGLDECEINEIKKFGRAISSLKAEPLNVFKIICTGRNGLETNLFTNSEPDFRLSVDSECIAGDVELYIRAALDQKLDDGDLIVADPVLILEIQQSLREGTKGMFLWTRFALEEICEQSDDQSIRQSLAQIPKELSALIEAKVSRIRTKRSAVLGIKVLQFAGVVRRPLTLHEMKELVTVKMGQTSLDRSMLVHNVHRLLDACCGLLHLEEESDTLQFVHSSVRTHLFSTLSEVNAEFNDSDSNRILGSLCLTYLNYTEFDQQISKRSKEADAAINILDIGLKPVTTRNSATEVARYLLQRSSSKRINALELSSRLQGMAQVKMNIKQDNEHYAFLEYAKKYWVYHCKDTNYFMRLPIFIQCSRGNSTMAQHPWENTNEFEPDVLAPQPLAWAVQNDITSVIDIVEHSRSRGILFALIDACSFGHMESAIFMRSALDSFGITLGPTYSEWCWFLLVSQNRDYERAARCMVSALTTFPVQSQIEYLKHGIWHSIVLDNLSVTLLLLNAAQERRIDQPFQIYDVLLRHAIITRNDRLLKLLLQDGEHFDGMCDVEAFDKICLVQHTAEDIRRWQSVELDIPQPCQSFDVDTFDYSRRRTEGKSGHQLDYHALVEACRKVRQQDVPRFSRSSSLSAQIDLEISDWGKCSPTYYAVQFGNHAAFDIITQARFSYAQNHTYRAYSLLHPHLFIAAITNADTPMLEKLLLADSSDYAIVSSADWGMVIAKAQEVGDYRMLEALFRHWSQHFTVDVRNFDLETVLSILDVIITSKDFSLLNLIQDRNAFKLISRHPDHSIVKLEGVLYVAAAQKDFEALEKTITIWKQCQNLDKNEASGVPSDDSSLSETCSARSNVAVCNETYENSKFILSEETFDKYRAFCKGKIVMNELTYELSPDMLEKRMGPIRELIPTQKLYPKPTELLTRTVQDELAELPERTSIEAPAELPLYDSTPVQTIRFPETVGESKIKGLWSRRKKSSKNT